MSSETRKKQLSWQARNGADPAKRAAAVRELREIGDRERRRKGGG